MDRTRPGRRGAQSSGAALDAMIPARCVACERRLRTERATPRRPFCADCEAALPWWRAVDGCPKCGEPMGPDTARACPRCLAAGSPLHRCECVLRYAGAVTRWIPGWKREGRTFGPPIEPERAIDFFARSLAARIVAREMPIDVLVPVPIHPRRFWRRGFDQAAWIAGRIARHGGPASRTGWLRRRRATAPQAALEGEARRANVRGAFAVTTPPPADVRIGLVDDVLTTGSTLEAAADVLLEAGALEVHALTLAATVAPAARRPREAGGHRDRKRTDAGDRQNRPSAGPVAGGGPRVGL